MVACLDGSVGRRQAPDKHYVNQGDRIRRSFGSLPSDQVLRSNINAKVTHTSMTVYDDELVKPEVDRLAELLANPILQNVYFQIAAALMAVLVTFLTCE
jgi:hypothetical protein